MEAQQTQLVQQGIKKEGFHITVTQILQHWTVVFILQLIKSGDIFSVMTHRETKYATP